MATKTNRTEMRAVDAAGSAADEPGEANCPDCGNATSACSCKSAAKSREAKTERQREALARFFEDW